MWGLQFYVSQQRQLFPEVGSCEAFARLDGQQKVIARDALWEHPDLIDACVRANPDKRTEEEFAQIGKWKGFLQGKFYVSRYLKDHAIFMGNSQAYGVKGLYEPFEMVLQGRPLPSLVEAVLLPYKGQIIYDGICLSYNIRFGRGIRQNLEEEYLAAKQNGRIQTSLEAHAKVQKSISVERPLATGCERAVAEIVQSSGRLRGGSAIQGATFGILRASAKLAEASILQPEDVVELQRIQRQVSNALKRLWRILERADM